MGLASKLQAAQSAMNTLGPMAAGMTAGGTPSAPPYPPAGHGSSPYMAPPAAGAAAGGGAAFLAGAAPYPAPQGQQMGGSPYPPPAGYPSSTPAGPYPSPYPPGSVAAGLPQTQQTPQQQQMPYPTQGMPPQQQQQQPPQMQPYPGQAPAQQQQQQMQQPYGSSQPQMGATAGAAAGAGGLAAAIQTKLSQIVSMNGLQRFYPPAALSALSSRLGSRVNFRELASRWAMPLELALDLAALALYDVVIVADDSGSMAFEENGERIDDLKMIAQKVSEVATLFDDDGILVRFMNSDVQGNSIRSPGDVSSLLGQVQYSGLTPLATSLQSKVLAPIVFSLAGSGQLAKPVLIITITDGEPTDNPKDLVVNVIKDAQNRLASQYGPKAVAFEFCQVGKDQRAQAFLAQLDAHPQVGGSIDCTSYYELECVEYARRGINLSPSMWLVKMMVGAIDLSHDKGDEHH